MFSRERRPLWVFDASNAAVCRKVYAWNSAGRSGHASVVVVRAALIAALLGLTGCHHAVPYRLTGQPGVMTLVDLHPHAQRPELWTMNYQQDGFLPICTPVVIEAVSAREARFVVPSLGVRFHYRVDDGLVEPFTSHLDRVFGEQCPTDVIAQLSPVDQAGISQGVALVGMSRQGVILALGPPPAQATPSLDMPVWRYWRNRHHTFVVRFVGDTVSEVEH